MIQPMPWVHPSAAFADSPRSPMATVSSAANTHTSAIE